MWSGRVAFNNPLYVLVFEVTLDPTFEIAMHVSLPCSSAEVVTEMSFNFTRTYHLGDVTVIQQQCIRLLRYNSFKSVEVVMCKFLVQKARPYLTHTVMDRRKSKVLRRRIFRPCIVKCHSVSLAKPLTLHVLKDVTKRLVPLMGF